MSKAIDVIREIITNIANDNVQDLIINLSKLPIQDMEQENSDKLLIVFMNTAAKYNKVLSATIVIRYWSETNINEEELPTITRLFMIPNIEDNTLSFIVRNFEGQVIENYFVDLINWDSSSEVLTAANRLILKQGNTIDEMSQTIAQMAQTAQRRKPPSNYEASPPYTKQK